MKIPIEVSKRLQELGYDAKVLDCVDVSINL